MNFESTQIQNQLTAWLLRRTATTGVRRVVSLSAAIASEIGNIRNENQDRAVITRGRDRQGRDYIVVAVADGIGGMRDGATCAAIAISTFLATIYQYAQMGTDSSEDWIRKAVNAANKAVFAKFRGDGGSTLVALLVRPGDSTCWLSVGDSRVYRSIGKNLIQISVDDTIAGQLGKGHEATPEQFKLLQFIGMGDELEPHIAKFDSEPTDAVVLTTDGVHFLAASTGILGQIISNAPDPGMCVKRLVDLAKWCGGPDNATVAMITFSANQEQEERPSYPCLEVWDAFGELQIITNETARITSPIANQFSTTAPEAAKPESAQATNNHPVKPKREATKVRRNKEARKAKGSAEKQDKGSPESPETKEPQLFMGFSNKSN
jgi:serine/threonine protein phosphatase PrpC